MTRWRHALGVAGLIGVPGPLDGQQGAAISLELPRDTTLAADGRWPLRVVTSRAAQITVILAPLHPDAAALHIESQQTSGPRTFWPLQGLVDGEASAGAYRLIVTAEEDGAPPATLVRVLVVERIAPDTQPHPPVLDQMAFLPESARTVSRRPGFLIITGIGLATLATTWTLSDNPTSSPVTIVVPGALAIGGIVGFFKGRATTHAVPANVAHNHRLVDDDAAARRRIASANAGIRAGAPLRVRVVDQP